MSRLLLPLLLAGCPGSSTIVPDSGPGGVDSGVPGDSGTGLPGDTSDSGNSDSNPDDSGDTADTGDEPWDPGTPDVVVDCNGGADFTTITAAIAASPSGTHIGLKPCTYKEDVDFIGKSLDIFGIEGPATTIIDGTGNTAVVTAADGESVGTRLAGVTLTGGVSGGYGSAVYQEGSALVLENVDIHDNGRSYAAIYGSGVFLEIDGASITDNRVSSGGAAIMVDNGSMLVQDADIDCAGGDYGIYEHNSLLVLDSTITCTSGYGIIIEGGELQARRSRIEGVAGGIYGEDNDDTRNERLWLYNTVVVGGDSAVTATYMHLKADHVVFWGDRYGLNLAHGHLESYVTNSVGVGSKCGIRSTDGSSTFGWNALQNNDGGCAPDAFSTVSADPAFLDAPNDFRLAAGSPLIDAGDPDNDVEDTDGSRADIGAYGGPLPLR